jgi:PelA/Pel-15E family pectate lyase
MKSIVRVFGILFLSGLICALAQTQPQSQPKHVKIVLVGDSTVNDEGGWGAGFRTRFDSNVEIINLAKNGRSSKSFRDQGLWAPVATAKADYVLIQFGHNDVPGKGPDRETDAATFHANMARYVDEARSYGAKPILVTSIIRRNFTERGLPIIDDLQIYVAETRKVALEKKVPLIDLYAATAYMGVQKGNDYAHSLGRPGKDGKWDTTHLGPKGQEVIGALAAERLMQLEPSLKAHRIYLTWEEATRQPSDWYSGNEAVRIADNLLLYQHDNGGWPKNIDMALPLDPTERANVIAEKKNENETTIDNDATYTQMRYLAQVYTATKMDRFKEAFMRGFEYLLKAQYPNGGWPQFYPKTGGYWTHITFNDNAMIGVMDTLKLVVEQDPDYAFVSDKDRLRAKQALDKGLDAILKTQVIVNGKPTVWCAQHDENTLAPAPARTYELVSLSGDESVGIVEYLMGIEHPSPEVIRAIQNAITWFSQAKIIGLRQERKPVPDSTKGFEAFAYADPTAPPIWARFYEIGTNRPIFSGRDGVKKYAMSEIEYERRTGYRWYIDSPATLLNEHYPAWMKKWAPTQDARIVRQSINRIVLVNGGS